MSQGVERDDVEVEVQLVLVFADVPRENPGDIFVRHFHRARLEPVQIVFGRAEKRGDEHPVDCSGGIGASLVVGHLEIVFATEETRADADPLLARINTDQCQEDGESGGEY